MALYHKPVLTREVLHYLNAENKNLIVDGTLGDGGHAELVLQRWGDQVRILGIDRDAEALKRARERLRSFGDRVIYVQGNFSEIKSILAKRKIRNIDGLFLDLGVSSMQLESPERGFSFMRNGPLDMRMDRKESTTAADLLASLSDEELKFIIKNYGEEKKYKNIIHGIRKAQGENPITSTRQLAKILSSAVKVSRPTRIHAATKTFQALRIAVNHELENIEVGLKDSLDVLRPGGRLVVISFHSLEDRLVKNFIRDQAKGCVCPPRFPQCVCGKISTLKVLTRKVVVPSPDETKANPRASSARLRAAERIYA